LRSLPVCKPHQLPPAAVTKFYGRKKQRNELVKRLSDRLNTAVVGSAGYGKTALAADAVREVVGDDEPSLAASPYPDGVVFLDLYSDHGQAEPVWHKLASTLCGPGFLERSPADERARQASDGRRMLVIIEGDEEADGHDGHIELKQLLSVLSDENRSLLLTREITQADPLAMVQLDDPLAPREAGQLFDKLTRSVWPSPIRTTPRGSAICGYPIRESPTYWNSSSRLTRIFTGAKLTTLWRRWRKPDCSSRRRTNSSSSTCAK